MAIWGSEKMMRQYPVGDMEQAYLISINYLKASMFSPFPDIEDKSTRFSLKLSP